MTNYDEDDRPPAGTPCCACKTKDGHFCPAKVYFANAPMCRFCVNGEACPVAIARRKLAMPMDELDEAPPPAPVRSIDPASWQPAIVDTAPVRADHGAAARAQAARLIRAVEARKTSMEKGVVNARSAVWRGTHPKPAAQPTIVEAPKREREREEQPMDEKKKCAHMGCLHNAAASGSYCSKRHFYLLKKERSEKAQTMQQPDKAVPDLPAAVKPDPAKTEFTQFAQPRHTVSPGSSPIEVLINLTEAECDALYRRCTPQQKAVAMATALQSMLQEQLAI